MQSSVLPWGKTLPCPALVPPSETISWFGRPNPNVHTHRLKHSQTHRLTHSQTHTLTDSHTHTLTDSHTHRPTHSQTHRLTHSQTHTHTHNTQILTAY